MHPCKSPKSIRQVQNAFTMCQTGCKSRALIWLAVQPAVQLVVQTCMHKSYSSEHGSQYTACTTLKHIQKQVLSLEGMWRTLILLVNTEAPESSRSFTASK